MRNHVRIAGQRECSWQLLADLREIDPTVDLHYLGNGVWVLGSVRPNKHRYVQAGRLLRDGHDRSTWMRRLWELTIYGFARVGVYQIQGEADSRIVTDFRQKDWRYRHEREVAFDEAMADADGTNELEWRKKLMLDDMEARTHDSWANFFRGRRSFDMGRGQ